MNLLKITFLVLLLFISASCNRNTPDINANSQSLTEKNEVQSEVIGNNGSLKENSEAHDSIVATENNSQEEVVKSQSQNEKSDLVTLEESRNSGWNWWLYGALFSIIFNLILIFLLLKTINSKNTYKWERDDITIGKDKYKEEAKFYKERLAALEDEKRKKQVPKTESPNTSVPQKTPNSSIDTEEKAVEVDLSVESSSSRNRNQTEIISRPVIFYSEKANENKIFTSVSEQKNEYKSIFKLILDNIDSDKAAFEIVDSDFVLRMAANSPDTYLYPVCKPENSNQNYSSEIITTKRGIAHKVDGKWQVNEQDKATIKFQ
ncbi:hypothetical protein [Christiangramia fulva]|nr:hypothetical protein [Christiangramia fulva]